jgi:hypothetical protein
MPSSTYSSRLHTICPLTLRLAALLPHACCCLQNLNWVWPLQRQEFTLIALINTGSLWLYEGPRSDSPSPLLVSRLISRGVAAMALPDNLLVQPLQFDNTLPPQLLPESFQCGKLDAGAMRPPGFWDGGVSEDTCICSFGTAVVAYDTEHMCAT